MLDIRLIRENPDEIIARLAAKGRDAKEDIAKILELDRERRSLIQKTDELKARQNKVSKEIPRMKKAGEDVSAIVLESRQLSDEIKDNDNLRKETEEKLNEVMAGLPNLPDPDLKPGGKENNEVLRMFGSPKQFDFEPKNHVDLCTDLGLIDYPRGAKLSGSGFWIYRGMGARLEWALLNYFIETHLNDGYELAVPQVQRRGLLAEKRRGRKGTLHASHGRNGSCQPAYGRDTDRKGASQEVCGLHPLLPQGGRQPPYR